MTKEPKHPQTPSKNQTSLKTFLQNTSPHSKKFPKSTKNHSKIPQTTPKAFSLNPPKLLKFSLNPTQKTKPHSKLSYKAQTLTQKNFSTFPQNSPKNSNFHQIFSTFQKKFNFHQLSSKFQKNFSNLEQLLLVSCKTIF